MKMRQLRSIGAGILSFLLISSMGYAAADREVTVLKANAYRDSELIRGEGDATATGIYAEAFNADPEFYAFTRSLRAYQDAFQGNGDIMLVQPDSEFFRYLKDSDGGKPKGKVAK